jgi:hypothetical protein
MRAAAPFMSSFVIYLISLSGAALLFKKFPKGFKSAQITLTVLFFVIALAIPGISTIKNNQVEQSVGSPLEEANSPMGIAKGINPGRVVWAYNPDATDKNCNNTSSYAYFMDSATDQDQVDQMLDATMLKITSKSTIKDSWDAVFKYHNTERGKGAISYSAGEIIFIKINRTSSWGGNFKESDLSRVTTNGNYAMSETSPQVVTSVLRHLVNIVGVAEDDIYIGDPMKHMYKDDYEKWHGEFPNVHYLDNTKSTLGREKVVKSTTAVIDYSDRGEVLRTGDWNDALDGSPIQTDNLYTIFEDMEYMINIPAMKAHIRAGVTMFAKNHFGSHTRESAKHLHAGLVEVGSVNPLRNTYGLYRTQVDMMGHELLGKKNLIFIMDALYASKHENHKPDKWQKAPWNGDWSSSLFVSLDPVAIESVGFDFLYYEYDGTSGSEYANPHYGAVDDYLHQAADKVNWPTGITYDPENDGTEIESLGVHEHWNNATDMQYSRNLGTADGIELVKLSPDFFTSNPLLKLNNSTIELKAYPNPVQNNLTLSFNIGYEGTVSATIYSLEGRRIASIDPVETINGTQEFSWNAANLNNGLYFVNVTAKTSNGTKQSTIKFEKQ